MDVPGENWDILQGAKIAPALGAVTLGLAMRYLVPVPEGINQQVMLFLSFAERP